MADPTQTAAQDSEEDFSIPGEDAGSLGNTTEVPPVAAPAASGVQSVQPPRIPAAPYGTQFDQPKASGRAMFLGNLLKTILSGVQNAPGNPNNAFDRGFMQASPQAQQVRQADISKVQSEADLAKMQATIAGMKAIKMKYQIDRMPQEEQEKYTQALGEFKSSLIKSGASVEGKGTDPQALDQQADLMNRTDPRATSHAGTFWSIPEPTEPGKAAKFDLIFVPGKNRLQESKDFTLPNGETLHLDQGMELDGAVGKIIEKLAGNAKDTSAEFVKSMHATLGNSKMPETQADADLRMKQLDSFIGLAGSTDPVWTHLAEQEKAAIQQNYRTLPKTKAETKPEQGTLQLVEKGKNPDGSPHMVAFNTKTGAIKEIEGGPIQPKGTSTPTQQMKTAAYRANTALAGIPDVISDIDRLGSKLGPIMGRWNEFIQGKGGFNDPEYAGLRADMNLLATAVTLAHAQGRMSDALRQDFQKMLNQPQQTPENVKAVLGKVKTWMERQSNVNAPPPGQGSSTQQAGQGSQGRPVIRNGQVIGYTTDGVTMTPVQ